MRWGLMPVLLLLCVLSSCASADLVSTSAGPSTVSAGTVGANAAPPAAPTPGSDPRRALFDQWFGYQAVEGADPGKNADLAWADAVAACAFLAVRDSVEQARARVQTLGWSLGGATAVVVGAVRAICPARDSVPPYRTAFDRDVAAAQHALRTELPWGGTGPDERVTGWFMKLACGQLQRGGLDTLESVLHSHRVGAANQHAPAAAFVQTFGADDVLLRRGTMLVVRQGCVWHLDSLRYLWRLP